MEGGRKNVRKVGRKERARKSEGTSECIRKILREIGSTPGRKERKRTKARKNK